MDTNPEKKSCRSLVPVLLVVWLLTIFISSCFFIERGAFIRFVSTYLPAGLVRSEWAGMWLGAGLFIVKGYHASEYFVLFALTFFTLERIRPWPIRKILLTSFVFALLFAASDEWHQTFVDGRGGTVVDVGIDSIGIVLASVTFAIKRRARRPDINAV